MKQGVGQILQVIQVEGDNISFEILQGSDLLFFMCNGGLMNVYGSRCLAEDDESMVSEGQFKLPGKRWSSNTLFKLEPNHGFLISANDDFSLSIYC